MSIPVVYLTAHADEITLARATKTDPLLKKVHTVKSEQELLQLAIEQLGIAIDADFCWVTLHDTRFATARIVCEYINPERLIYPIGNIGKEIDVLLYPLFYNHLFEIESWIDPPLEIIPSLYFNLLSTATEILICPITVDLQGVEYYSKQGDDWTIGEVGILTTGKPDWTILQANSIAQVISYAVKIFRQNRIKSLDKESIVPSLEWLNSLKDNFISSIADVNRDMHISAEMLQQQIHLFDVETNSLAVVRHHQFSHQKLAENLEVLQAEWRRQFQLIDILINIQTDAQIFQIQSLSDILFGKWLTEICKSCSDLATKYHQDFSFPL